MVKNDQYLIIHLMFLLSLSMLLNSKNTFAQTYTAQTLESFNYADGNLDGQNGGWGWMGSWIADDASAAATYTVGGINPFSYAKPATSAYYITPGKLSGNNTNGKIIGRYLNTSPTGPYAAFLDANGSIKVSINIIGGFLLRKTAYDDSQVYYGVSNGLSTADPNDGLNNSFVIGYFGPLKSNQNGKRYWTVKRQNNYYITSIEVVANKDEFFTFEINGNGNGTYLNVWKDPVIQNGYSATTIWFQQAVSGPTSFKSVFFYSEGGNSIDELWFTTGAIVPGNRFVYDPWYRLIGVDGAP